MGGGHVRTRNPVTGETTNASSLPVGRFDAPHNGRILYHDLQNPSPLCAPPPINVRSQKGVEVSFNKLRRCPDLTFGIYVHTLPLIKDDPTVEFYT